MIGQIPARCRSATSFEPVCNQDSITEFGLKSSYKKPNLENRAKIDCGLFQMTLSSRPALFTIVRLVSRVISAKSIQSSIKYSENERYQYWVSADAEWYWYRPIPGPISSWCCECLSQPYMFGCSPGECDRNQLSYFFCCKFLALCFFV